MDPQYKFDNSGERSSMNLLDHATDWTNQTAEERAEACAAFLFTFRFLGHADHYRTLNRIRAVADIQRESQVKGEVKT
ncbi:MAG: hypothetical protein K0R64_1540 [Novosphingobium lindaniclasticum]|jgi:hypothetical protein|uniref:hypothetical protein n=1 Tax=Novosphingobium lindaniclasticum TaxID=1329895 RepID=UPI00240A84EF|nr:hypothetical protein [Novosphingobium lindaniclasticum]MDF2638556.1 hypothetical protein [Novosphingobium lindaniclasticum]